MTRTKTVTEQTIHGSIEYDVIECDSCGQDVMEDEANEFTIGDREGYACSACVDEGPAGFPTADEISTGKLILLITGWPLWFVVVSDEWGEGTQIEQWFAGSMGAILWLGIGFNILRGIGLL